MYDRDDTLSHESMSSYYVTHYNTHPKPRHILIRLIYTLTANLATLKREGIRDLLGCGAYEMYHQPNYVFQLAAVKTYDKTMTLMHYLVEFTRTTYPKLLDFHEGLDIAVAKGS